MLSSERTVLRMNISDRIQSLRKAKGMTQEQLADALGVSRQAVSKWEAEQSMPDLERIVAMAEYFDVTTDYILRGIEPVRAAPRGLNTRTAAVIATALNAAGVVIGAALWYEYQNALGPALLLVLQLAGTAVWLLHREGCPRWFWAVNVWLLSVIPCFVVGNTLGYVLYDYAWREMDVTTITSELLASLARLLPLIIWLIVGTVVTRRVLKRAR